MKFRWIVILFCLLIVQSHAQTRDVFRDACMWNTFNLKHKLFKKTSLVLTEELRLMENYTQLNLTYTDLGVEYAISKSFRATLSYRHIQKYIYDQPVSFRHRMMLDLLYRKSRGRFGFSYRQRFQSEVKDYGRSKMGKQSEWFSRSKFTLKYLLTKRLSPYAAIELRYQIRDPRNPRYDRAFHRNRYQAGCDYKLSRQTTVGLYYLMQHEYNIENRTELHVLGVEFSFDF
ncbi:MAG: DUF2490 domain-containing protein [Bacteroidetes bacterium]|nr:DUF2490 domain-containing protein [Bacteroidota bacterium]